MVYLRVLKSCHDGQRNLAQGTKNEKNKEKLQI